MQLIENVRAYQAIRQMMQEEWDFPFIYPLLCLLSELTPSYDYFSRSELELVSRYGKKEADGTVALDDNGAFTFADLESATAYIDAHHDLCHRETPSLPKIKLTRPDHIRGQWLSALLPFCTFEKAGDPHGQIA